MEPSDNDNAWVGPIRHCARCGQDHENLTFKRFHGAPIEDSDGTIWVGPC